MNVFRVSASTFRTKKIWSCSLCWPCQENEFIKWRFFSVQHCVTFRSNFVISWLGSGRVTKSCPSSPNRRIEFSVPPQYLCSMWDNLPWFSWRWWFIYMISTFQLFKTYIFAIIILPKRMNRQNFGEDPLLYIRFSPGNTGQSRCEQSSGPVMMSGATAWAAI